MGSTRDDMRPVRRRDLARGRARDSRRDGRSHRSTSKRSCSAEANGRVLASDVDRAGSMCRRFRAPAWTATPYARATRRARRALHPRTLTKVGRSTPARCPQLPVRRRQCVEISTGAPMPDGADAVVMVEETDSTPATTSRIFAEVQPQQNVGARGADIQNGTGGRRRGRDPELEPHRRARRRRHLVGRRVSRGRASRFSRRATKSSSQDRN